MARFILPNYQPCGLWKSKANGRKTLVCSLWQNLCCETRRGSCVLAGWWVLYLFFHWTLCCSFRVDVAHSLKNLAPFERRCRIVTLLRQFLFFCLFLYWYVFFSLFSSSNIPILVHCHKPAYLDANRASTSSPCGAWQTLSAGSHRPFLHRRRRSYPYCSPTPGGTNSTIHIRNVLLLKSQCPNSEYYHYFKWETKTVDSSTRPYGYSAAEDF